MWVPPKVSRELVEERRAREAEAARAMVTDHLFAHKKQFDAELARIDENLRLVWVPDPAPFEAVAAGCLPGRWHVVRFNPGAPMGVIVLETETGGFLEPGAHVFEMLARADLWDDRNVRAREKRLEQLTRARENREAREREERREEIRERVKAATDVRISFSPEHRWSQNVNGRKGRRTG